MDPIQHRVGPGDPSGVNPTDRARQAGQTKSDQAFNVGDAQAPGSPEAVSRASSPVLDRLAAVMADARSQGLDRAATRAKMVEAIATDTYGDDATPAMIESVSKAMEEDPALASLVHRLVNALRSDTPE